MGRIISQKEASLISKEEKEKGRRVVFTNGCFDIIHKGHIELLKQAKDRGDILIVGLNSDSSTKKIKGKGRPIIDEESRAVVLSSIVYVDYVVIFNEKTPYNLIKVIRPDILVKGEDWSEEEIVGRELAREVVRVKLILGYSTTEMVKKIKRLSHKISNIKHQNSNKL
ncbi:MAG: adenylyltransferase/cytidyltransferase family protein [bacterium]|nr:adenylyltransferase/cytidyltransferase family protein [bacterium]